MAIAAPLVSVALVRVSLTVRIEQRTDLGALALCSAGELWGMAEIVVVVWNLQDRTELTVLCRAPGDNALRRA